MGLLVEFEVLFVDKLVMEESVEGEYWNFEVEFGFFL